VEVRDPSSFRFYFGQYGKRQNNFGMLFRQRQGKRYRLSTVGQPYDSRAYSLIITVCAKRETKTGKSGAEVGSHNRGLGVTDGRRFSVTGGWPVLKSMHPSDSL
jgi:hypothetical protein